MTVVAMGGLLDDELGGLRRLAQRRAQMTSGEMAGLHLAHCRGLDTAARLGIGTAGMEVTAGRGTHRTWNLSRQYFERTHSQRLGHRHRIEQRFRIWMLRRGKQI